MRKRVASRSSVGPSTAPLAPIPSVQPTYDVLACYALNIPSSIDAEKLHKLRGKYQIPYDIHTYLPATGEWCCTPNSPGIGIYDAYMLGGLSLPLGAFAREILTRLGISPNQLNPNDWRIIVAMQVLWREVFEGNRPFTVDEFLYCYKPSRISQSLGFYQFSAQGSNCRMIRSLPTSDREWKKEFFFVSSPWVGDPFEVGRDTFPPLVSDWGHLRPKGT